MYENKARLRGEDGTDMENQKSREEAPLPREGLQEFAKSLAEEERSPGTIAKYLRDVTAFAAWIGERPVTRAAAAGWKEHLLGAGYRPATINAMLAAVNKYFRFLGWEDRRVKPLRLQRVIFRGEERELSRREYNKLLDAAQDMGRGRLALLMETICATGIRVSEVRYITLESLRQGRCQVDMKGKIRVILLPGKLRRKLLAYAKKEKIVSGEIFLTRTGRPVTRKQIWAEMKGLCQRAGVAATKVFPHNLRHLFARVFYQASRDVARLADVLGHASIETTRVYLVTTGVEQARQMDRLGLIR